MSLQARPAAGRIFTARRRIRLSDMDARGRLRLDAIARYLQDVASDDVADAGWSADEHVWVVRRTELEIARQLVADEEVELATWCSGTGASAASRRTTIAGDGGGRIDAESVWIHLDRDGRPARLSQRFAAVYAATAAGRGVSTKLTLRGPAGGDVRAWPLRATDADILGHVNNAVYWAAIEDVAAAAEVRHAVLEYRQAIDVGDAVELRWRDGEVGFVVDGSIRAASRVARST